MHRFNKSIWFGLFVMTAYAQAQNTFPATGNVGIGTTNPGSLLDIATSGTQGSVFITQSTNDCGDMLLLRNTGTGVSAGVSLGSFNGFITGSLLFSVNGNSTGGTTPAMEITNSGNVGLSTTTPTDRLHILGTTSGQPGQLTFGDGGNFSPYMRTYKWSGTGSTYFEATIGNSLSSIGGIDFQTGIGGAGIGSDTQTTRMTIMPATGNVGIGTTSPQAKLEINGNLRFTADGSIQTTAWTGILCGGDYAESVDVTGDRTKYGPGDVLVIDPDDSGKFFKSGEPYSTAVLGIYSTKPGAIGRRQNNPKSAEEVPMAMIGIVPTKVSAENGPIKPGDLLVTSSTPGYAMKGTDRRRLVGAVIGKALGRLDSGTGVIEVGVTLQ